MRAKFVFYFGLEQLFEQGVGSLAEGAHEPEIAYASARIRPFSRLQPSKPPMKIELP
jgi:hypothetical protein